METVREIGNGVRGGFEGEESPDIRTRIDYSFPLCEGQSWTTP